MPQGIRWVAANNAKSFSVVACILGEANILPKIAEVNGSSLPKIEMPNRNGFVPDPRPEVELYRWCEVAGI